MAGVVGGTGATAEQTAADQKPGKKKGKTNQNKSLEMHRTASARGLSLSVNIKGLGGGQELTCERMGS